MFWHKVCLELSSLLLKCLESFEKDTKLKITCHNKLANLDIKDFIIISKHLDVFYKLEYFSDFNNYVLSAAFLYEIISTLGK